MSLLISKLMQNLGLILIEFIFKKFKFELFL